ncbi:MAG: hypothetical protein ACOZQL_29560 [Myxococcota bacterium]
MVLAPFLGGASIDVPGRRLRLAAPPPKPGWYRFEVKGRLAQVQGEADAPPLDELPRVRGYLWRDRLVGDGAKTEPLALMPDEEPPRFSPLTARRWPGDVLLFEQLEFESEAEGAVREALAEGRALSSLKGVPAPLRAAYGYALIEQAARRLGVPVAAAEIQAHVGRAAEGGAVEAEAVIRALIAEREETEREMRELRARIAAARLRADAQAARDEQLRLRAERHQTAEDRAFAALEKAGARFESSRQLRDGQLEVVFAFMGERFISIADAGTLQVIDSGICLGHPPRDDLITLESLPSVIKEAIDTHRLVILREP